MPANKNGAIGRPLGILIIFESDSGGIGSRYYGSVPESRVGAVALEIGRVARGFYESDRAPSEDVLDE